MDVARLIVDNLCGITGSFRIDAEGYVPAPTAPVSIRLRLGSTAKTAA
jgi:hypothetical protein